MQIIRIILSDQAVTIYINIRLQKRQILKRCSDSKGHSTISCHTKHLRSVNRSYSSSEMKQREGMAQLRTELRQPSSLRATSHPQHSPQPKQADSWFSSGWPEFRHRRRATRSVGRRPTAACRIKNLTILSAEEAVLEMKSLLHLYRANQTVQGCYF